MRITPARRIILAVAITAFLSVSCSLPAGIGSRIRESLENAISTDEDVQPAASETSATAAIVDGTPENPITSLTGNDTGTLDSYRLSFSVTSNGKDDTGNDILLDMQMESEVDNNHSIRHNIIRFKGTGAAGQTGNVDVYQQNEQSYVYDAGNEDLPCLSVGTAGDLLSSPSINPDDFIQSIETGELLESNVIVNNIAADHYRVKNANIDLGDVHFQNGEVWVATEGGANNGGAVNSGFIVRFTGQAEGDVSDGTHQGTGTTGWVYNLYDVNKDLEIVIPETCLNRNETTLDDVPVPDNAFSKFNLNGIITFDSPDGQEKVSTFYRIRLKALGWNLSEETVTAGVAMLTFEKDDRNLQIMITLKSNDGSSVIITSVALH